MTREERRYFTVGTDRPARRRPAALNRPVTPVPLNWAGCRMELPRTLERQTPTCTPMYAISTFNHECSTPPQPFLQNCCGTVFPCKHRPARTHTARGAPPAPGCTLRHGYLPPSPPRLRPAETRTTLPTWVPPAVRPDRGETSTLSASRESRLPSPSAAGRGPTARTGRPTWVPPAVRRDCGETIRLRAVLILPLAVMSPLEGRAPGRLRSPPRMTLLFQQKVRDRH